MELCEFVCACLYWIVKFVGTVWFVGVFVSICEWLCDFLLSGGLYGLWEL